MWQMFLGVEISLNSNNVSSALYKIHKFVMFNGTNDMTKSVVVSEIKHFINDRQTIPGQIYI